MAAKITEDGTGTKRPFEGGSGNFSTINLYKKINWWAAPKLWDKLPVDVHPYNHIQIQTKLKTHLLCSPDTRDYSMPWCLWFTFLYSIAYVVLVTLFILNIYYYYNFILIQFVTVLQQFLFAFPNSCLLSRIPV